MRIKELYASDSDANSISQWSAEEIAKINYNFQLLANNTMSSHIGNQGPSGSDGGLGDSGATGIPGIAGETGPNGENPEMLWSRNGAISPGNLTINPSNNNNPSIPSHIVIGLIASNNIPSNGSWNSGLNQFVLNSNFDSNNSYIATHPWSTSSSAAYTSDELDADVKPATLKINRTHQTAGGTRESIKLINDVSLEASIGFNVNKFSIISATALEFLADTIKFHSSDNINDLIVSSDSISTVSDFTTSNTITINNLSSLQLSAGDPSNVKVMKSTDTNGLVKWEEIDDSNLVGYKLPIGSIIQISNGDFLNEDNFEISYPDSGIVNNLIVESTTGRGKGKYKGWYSCNGYRWSNPIMNTNLWGSVSPVGYDTPKVNNTDFRVNGYPYNDADSLDVILGGGTLNSTSDYNSLTSTLTYSNTGSHDTHLRQMSNGIGMENVAYDIIAAGTHNSNLRILDKTVYVVYLGSGDLYQYIEANI